MANNTLRLRLRTVDTLPLSPSKYRMLDNEAALIVDRGYHMSMNSHLGSSSFFSTLEELDRVRGFIEAYHNECRLHPIRRFSDLYYNIERVLTNREQPLDTNEKKESLVASIEAIADGFQTDTGYWRRNKRDIASIFVTAIVRATAGG